jgi:hypothetical protein
LCCYYSKFCFCCSQVNFFHLFLLCFFSQEITLDDNELQQLLLYNCSSLLYFIFYLCNI